MRISTRLRIITGVTIAALVILIPILVWSFVEFKNAKDDDTLADALHDNYFERASFRDQYFLYREDRIREQWAKSKHETDRLVAQAKVQFHRAHDQQVLERFSRSIEDTTQLFDRIFANTQVINTAGENRGVYEEFDRRLYSQLLLIATDVRMAITTLQSSTERRVQESYRQLTIIAILFALTLALAVILVAHQMDRLIRRRLLPLHAAVELVAQGNLGYRIETNGSDEFSELALGINSMTGKLQELTQNLEKQVAERTEALQISEERWKFAIEGAGDGLWDWNNQTGKAFYSPRYKEMFGYAEADIGDTADEWSKRIHPDDAPGVMAALQPYMDGKPGSATVEFRMLCKDGSWKWTLGRGMVVSRDAEGKPLRMIGTNTDISERKQAELALRESEETFRTLASLAPVGIYLTTPDGDCLYANTRWCEMAGMSLTEALGNGWLSGVHPDDRELVASNWHRMVASGGAWGHEYRFRTPEGVVTWVYGMATPQLDAAGNITRYIGINLDISERKLNALELEQHRHHLEQLVEDRTADLIQAKKVAETANIAKSAFLANMSHEIRTPMNGIIGMAHILRREGVTPQQAKRLDTIDASAQHLLSVINDVLDISKIEAGKFELEDSPVVVSSLMTNVESILSERAKAKSLQLKIESGNLPPNLVGDPTRLQQALLNYATNAVKFTETGTVSLRVLLQEESADAVTVRFEVQDTGIGIAPEAMSRLFSAFEQADNSMTRKYGGTGLGLVITQRLAELMGGKVGADSTVGVGSTFWFTVKLKKGEAEAVAPTATAVDAEAEIRQRYARQRILVVDDEPINREVTLIQLEDLDLLTDTAEDGVVAVAMARKNNYAAIFMDMQMPKLNGVEATQEIRQIPGYRDTPIIAMTANAFAEDKAQCLAAGMNDFLIKPFNPDEMFAVLLRSLRRSKG